MSTTPVMPRTPSETPNLVARALWYVKPGLAEVRSESLPPLAVDEVRVKSLYGFASRGTERLVALGQVPESEWQRMRAPFQAGDFPFPVKYGYSTAGVVIAGRPTLLGKHVFCLHPHQDVFQVHETKLAGIPPAIPPRRATLAANMETALNAHWDGETKAGERLLIVGAGIVGMLTAFLAMRLAGADVWITDVDDRKRNIAEALGLSFVPVSNLPRDSDLVFHTSTTAAGLQSAIDAAANEARIVEMSWYGDQPVTLSLGGTFHARRLKLISSQVGQVAPSRRSTHSHAQRLTEALRLLDDARLDVLVAEEIAFESIATQLPKLLTDPLQLQLPVIRYPD